MEPEIEKRLRDMERLIKMVADGNHGRTRWEIREFDRIFGLITGLAVVQLIEAILAAVLLLT